MTQQITCTPTPPITADMLPIEVTICIKEPGTLKLSWDPSGSPTETTMTDGDLCTGVYIPADVLGLVCKATGALDLRIV